MSTAFVADQERREGHTHVLLITTGSVASIKAPLIVKELLSVSKLWRNLPTQADSSHRAFSCIFSTARDADQYANVCVEVVSTKPSLVFFKKEDMTQLGARVWTDEDEWKGSYTIGEPILHIELRRWADIVLVAPCSANTLAKIAGGICDNLVTSLLRALAPTTPTYIFPAMNTLMYEHPLTGEHLRIIRDVVGYNVVGPIGKKLACGDIGLGAMTEWKEIVQVVVDKYLLKAHADTSTI